MTFRVYAFDAYGTLFDVHSAVARHRDSVGPQADRLSDIWRTKQLEYTWVRTLSGRYRDFQALTADALDFAAARCGGISADARIKLLAAYETLDAYGDVRPALGALRARGMRTAILSNGTPGMLARATTAAGIADLLDATLSVDELRQFKTSASVYALVGERFGVAPSYISFQSSNRWDIAGASAFGFRTVWINRTGQPDEYGDMPAAKTLTSLAPLAQLDA